MPAVAATSPTAPPAASASAPGATVVNPFTALNGGTRPGAAVADTEASADRFLTLLVTQLKNQDPLNPLDNAQITSQMAQINAVTGLEKVNQSVRSLNTQMLQMQALQGAALVGHDVMLDGDRIVPVSGRGQGAVDLAGAADRTRVEVLDASGRVVGSIDLGAREAGRHEFTWNAGSAPAGEYHFRVVSTLAGREVANRPLTIDRVQSVAASGDALTLTLAGHGTVALADIVSFH